MAGVTNPSLVKESPHRADIKFFINTGISTEKHFPLLESIIVAERNRVNFSWSLVERTHYEFEQLFIELFEGSSNQDFIFFTRLP